jgi:modulator of FtsH protease HflC
MKPLHLALAVVGLILVLSTTYTVSQTDQVILTQFGKPVGGPIVEPGLHFKVPFVQTVNRFDKRWLEYDGDPNQIPTRDKKYIWVEIYARWRIQDPLLYFQAVRDEDGAQRRLDGIVDGLARDAIASFDLIELVRSSNRAFQVTEDLEGIGSAEAMAKVVTGRDKISQAVLGKAKEITKQFGVELEDVRFKRIKYIDTVEQKVFERMISERRRIAERSRSEGQGRAAEIRGEMERDVLAASSVGYRSAQELKGKANAKAAAIYAGAYGSDAEFYQFTKSMEALASSLDEKSTLVLTTNSELLKYLKSDGSH